MFFEICKMKSNLKKKSQYNPMAYNYIWLHAFIPHFLCHMVLLYSTPLLPRYLVYDYDSYDGIRNKNQCGGNQEK